MTNITLTAQNVNGDPFTDGKNIKIVNNSTSVLTFVDTDHTLNDPLTGEAVSFDGGTTLLSYQFLGAGNVRGDPLQQASFIRIDMGDGSFLTVALDWNADFDDLPDLQNGNTQLSVSDLDDISTNWFPGFACFVGGTLIEADDGPRAVETLKPGDMIRTLDNGLQPLVYLASTKVRAVGALAPVRFAAGAIGNWRDLYVSQQHRMIVSGWRTQLYFGESEVFVPAKQMVNDTDIRIIEGGRATYHHLLFARHEVVLSEGIWSESYFPDAELGEDARAAHDEALMMFPDLAHHAVMPHQTARRVARGIEARVLMAA